MGSENLFEASVIINGILDTLTFSLILLLLVFFIPALKRTSISPKLARVFNLLYPALMLFCILFVLVQANFLYLRILTGYVMPIGMSVPYLIIASIAYTLLSKANIRLKGLEARQ